MAKSIKLLERLILHTYSRYKLFRDILFITGDLKQIFLHQGSVLHFGSLYFGRYKPQQFYDSRDSFINFQFLAMEKDLFVIDAIFAPGDWQRIPAAPWTLERAVARWRVPGAGWWPPCPPRALVRGRWGERRGCLRQPG